MLLHVIALLIGIIALVVFVIDLIFLLPTIHGAIYLPSSDEQIQAMLRLAKVKKGERAVDIGAGDGRIVRKLAHAGAVAHGFEINPILVLVAWWQSRLLPRGQRGAFHWANMWWVDFSKYQVVTLFGMTYIMRDLERKLQKELPKGARVVSNSFPFPNWKPVQKLGSVYLYQQD